MRIPLRTFALRFWPLIFVLLFILNTALYAGDAAAAYVNADVWRHLWLIILPLLEGDASWMVLWSNAHPSPLLHLTQIFSLRFFDFRMDVIAYIGFAFQILGLALILFWLRPKTDHGYIRSNLWAIGALSSAVLVFGFTATNQYSNELIAIQQVFFFVGLLFLICIDHAARSTHPKWHQHLAWITSGVLLVLVVNADWGTLFVAPTIAILFVAFAISRQWRHLHMALGASALLLASHLILSNLLGAGSSGGGSIAWLEVMARIPQMIAATALGLATGLYGYLQPIRSIYADWPVATLSLAVAHLLAYLALLVVFLYRRQPLESLVPAFLMAFPLLFAGAVLVFRDTPQSVILQIAIPRYVPALKLGGVGAIWALYALLAGTAGADGHQRESTRFPVGTVVFVLLMALFLGEQLTTVRAGWEGAPYVAKWHEREELALFLFGDKENQLARSATRSPGPHDRPLAFLVERNLNVFSGRYPAHALLDTHRKAKAGFAGAEDDVLSLPRDAEGQTLATNDGPLGIEQQGRVLRVSGDHEAKWYLRLGMTAPEADRQGLQRRVGSDRWSELIAFPGKQFRYFELQPRTTYRFRIAPDVRWEGAWLRRDSM